jgi:hypothetical protein
LTDHIGPIKLSRNRKTGKRFLAVTELNGDVIYAELDENDKPINAGNRFTREEFNKMLDELDMEPDESTVNFAFSGGDFVERKRPRRL